MVSQRKRRLFFGLGLVAALALAVGTSSAAAAVSTLTGENLSGSSSSGNSSLCPTLTWSVSGTAAGPYPGTFSESGTSEIFAAQTTATFTITSGTTTITGSKSDTSAGCGSSSPFAFAFGAAYTATIHTPNGNFHDEGASNVLVVVTGSAATATESFTSSLTAPVLIAPTSKDQCKNNGWKNFPQFKNQGQCVSSVQSQT